MLVAAIPTGPDAGIVVVHSPTHTTSAGVPSARPAFLVLVVAVAVDGLFVLRLCIALCRDIVYEVVCGGVSCRAR